MTSDRDPAFPWRAIEAPALDANGPPSLPFRHFPAAWSDRPAIGLLRDAAQRFADRTASDDGEHRLTYGEMWAAVCRLARTIDDATVPGAPVAVLLPSDAYFQIGLLACLAAGRPCVVLDRNYPADRNADIIRDAAVRAVILSAADAPDELKLPDGVRALRLAEPAPPDAPVPALPEVAHQPDAPAFIIYTSGSTGRPKGVVLSQRMMLHRTFQKIESLHKNEHDISVSLRSPCTVGGLLQVFECVVSGAALMQLDLQRHSLGAALRAVADRRATIMVATPAVWRAISRLENVRALLSSLRSVQTAGDVLLQADLELMRGALPSDCAILNVYGATEVPALLQWFVPRRQDMVEARVPAGYPIPGFDYAIVDEAGGAVAAGEPGELVIRSRYTAIGAWLEGGLRDGPFAVDPEDPALRIYRTGDLVRMRADGAFVTLGRKDRQLKIRDNRIEPAEIENVLRGHPAVLEAAVVARRNGETVTLLAFVVARQDSNPALLDDLKARLRGALPSHMQPTQVLSIDAMPLLPGRKVDEGRLLAIAAEAIRPMPAPSTTRAASRRSRDRVAQAWRRTMDRQSLEADRPFSEAGGDSLRLLELIFYLEQRCEIDLPLEAFHGDMRPSQFAAALDQCLEGSTVTPADLPCVVLVPGYGGDEPRLAQFRADCADALRFVTIKYPDWATLAAPGSSCETVVTDVVRQIEAACGSSRLLIAGYSMGGDFAYAAATRLAASGRDVGLLVVLDTDTRSSTPSLDASQFAASKTPAKRRLSHFVEAVRQSGWDGLAGAIRLDQLVERRWFLSLLRTAARVPLPMLPAKWLFRPRRLIFQALLTGKHTVWCETLVPVRQDVPTVLFRSEQRRSHAAPDLGWSARCASVDVVGVHGDHRTMFDAPQRRELSSRFVQVVSQACANVDGARTSNTDRGRQAA
ncbi:MAG TPA: AMP-binding protein [Vineibacter sp.]|nr:AMP-binding protein [Vineibacter sp.]